MLEGRAREEVDCFFATMSTRSAISKRLARRSFSPLRPEAVLPDRALCSLSLSLPLSGPRVPSGGVTLKRRCTYRPSVIYLIVNKLLSLSLSLLKRESLFSLPPPPALAAVLQFKKGGPDALFRPQPLPPSHLPPRLYLPLPPPLLCAFLIPPRSPVVRTGGRE
jgi:hypothetical protein